MRIILEKKFSKKLKEIGAFRSIVTLFLVLAFPVILYMLFTRQNIRQEAATSKTATMKIDPPSAIYSVGQQFVVNLVIDGGGQAFNAAQANISVSPNLTIKTLDITPSPNGCNFTFVKTNRTPTITDPSFAGGILNGSSVHCTLYSMLLEANAIGTGTISFSKASVKAYANNAEILLSADGGTYTISTPVTPTPTLTPTPTTPPATPTPITSPTPIPTTIVLEAPLMSLPSDTYINPFLISGTKTTSISQVYINDSTTGVSYPSSTTWEYSATLTLGLNSFNAYGKDASGNKSPTITGSITLHKMGDISGDNVIDLTDLSMFATDWENTGSLNYPLSDMNQDALVDLTDFSIIAKAYGN